jgi:FAD dependent oxidoreductase.
VLAPRLRLLEEENGAGPYLELAESGYAKLPQLLSALWPERARGHFQTAITALEGSARSWGLKGSAGEVLLEGTEEQPVILATGAALKALAPVATGQVGGQLDRFSGPAQANAPLLSGRGHGFHDGEGWVVGSTYRHAPPWATATAEDREGNRARLAAWKALLGWPEAGGAHQQSFTGLRANSPDRAPLVGTLASGFLVSTGHASSGLTTAFLSGEISGQRPRRGPAGSRSPNPRALQA